VIKITLKLKNTKKMEIKNLESDIKVLNNTSNSFPEGTNAVNRRLNKIPKQRLYNYRKDKTIMEKISTCLWFDNQAEEATKLYTSIFKNSKIGTTSHYDEATSKASGMPAGSVLTITFEIEGRNFMALNGGPIFKFNESVSFMVNCKSQEEVDYYWNKLTEGGGQESQCGWLKDKFGVSWQIVPEKFYELMSSKDSEKTKRVLAAMLLMKKFIVADLQKAYDGK
jgi:predicted 3-demethylubiquinone-9 3-methyltransferase (glyoxalase superfamily)